VPEATIAFDETLIQGWIAAAGLRIEGEMQPGRWCGGDPGRDLQDVLVLRRIEG
jgi:hypothetical protein